MKTTSIQFFILTLFLTALFLGSCNEKPSSPPEGGEDAVPTQADLVKQGEYLVTIMGCHDCHSPKKMGPQGPELIPELMLSGYPAERGIPEFDSKLTDQGYAMMVPDLTAFKGPWGISFAANLTPDESGLQLWTEEQFKKAMKEGKFKGLDNSRPLLPPMPWFNFINIKDEDVHAIFTYLQSIQPVKNIVPQPVLAAMPPAEGS